jgi:hypothetical protein
MRLEALQDGIELVGARRHAEMSDAALLVGEHLLWLGMQRDLHAVEPDVDPSVAGAPQLAPSTPT